MYCVKCYETNDWKDPFYVGDWGDPGSLRLIGHRKWSEVEGCLTEQKAEFRCEGLLVCVCGIFE